MYAYLWWLVLGLPKEEGRCTEKKKEDALICVMNAVTGKSVHAAIWSKFHTQLQDSTGGFCLFMDHPVVFGVYYKL